MLNFIKCNLNKCSSQVKESAFLTMVRSQLEYASDVWDPHHVRYYNYGTRKVHWRAARWVLNDYGRFSSVPSMLDQLSWPTLQTRSKVSRLHTLHKASVLLSVITYNRSILLISNTINETISSATLHLTLFNYLLQHTKIAIFKNDKWLKHATKTPYWRYRY